MQLMSQFVRFGDRVAHQTATILNILTDLWSMSQLDLKIMKHLSKGILTKCLICSQLTSRS